MGNKLKPALLGGLIVGVLSAIPLVGYCCLIWGLGGGALAANLYIKNSPTQVKMGDGAIVGGLAGGVGGIIYFVITLPITMLAGSYQENQLAKAGITLPVSGFWLYIVIVMLSAILLALLAPVGGIIGVAIFEKRKGDVTPPAPPNGFSGGATF
jgi:hypothetical protein